MRKIHSGAVVAVVLAAGFSETIPAQAAESIRNLISPYKKYADEL